MAYISEVQRSEAIAWAHGRSASDVHARIDELCKAARKLAARVADDALNNGCSFRSEDVAAFGPRQRKAYELIGFAYELNAVADETDRVHVTETVPMGELRTGDVIARDGESWSVQSVSTSLTMPATVILQRGENASRRSHVRTATVVRIVPEDVARERSMAKFYEDVAARDAAQLQREELAKLEDGTRVPERMARPLAIEALQLQCLPFSAAHGPFRCGADADNGESKLAVHYWSDGNRSGYFCGFHSPYDVARAVPTAAACYDNVPATAAADGLCESCGAFLYVNDAGVPYCSQRCTARGTLSVLPVPADEDVARILDYGKGHGRSTVEELARHWAMDDYEYASDGDGASFSVVSLDTEDTLWLAFASLLDTCTSWSGANCVRTVRDVTADELPRELESWSDVRALGVENDAQGFVYVTSYRGLWAINDAERDRDAWAMAYGEHAEDCDCDREDCAERRAELAAEELASAGAARVAGGLADELRQAENLLAAMEGSEDV